MKLVSKIVLGGVLIAGAVWLIHVMPSQPKAIQTQAGNQTVVPTSEPTNVTIGTTPSVPKSSTAQTQASSPLTPFTEMKSDGVSISVPTTWTPKEVQGGDFTTWEVVNPKNKKEFVKIVYSGCVGCYMGGSSQTPNPNLVLPEDNDVVTKTFNKGLSLDYQTSSILGTLSVSTNYGGYAYAEVNAPKSDLSLVRSVIQSFSFAN